MNLSISILSCSTEVFSCWDTHLVTHTVIVCAQLDVSRLLSPVQSLEICLLWLNQSVVRSNDTLSNSASRSLSLKSNSISLVLVVYCRICIQLLRMLNLQTSSYNTIISIEESVTCIVKLWRSNLTQLLSSSTCMIVVDIWLQEVVTLDIFPCHISIRWVHVILNTPCWTVVEYSRELFTTRLVSQTVREIIIDISNSFVLVVLVTQSSLMSQVLTMQVIVSYSLDTIQVNLWHEYQACKITRERDNYFLTSNTLYTSEDQVSLIKSSSNYVRSFLNELNIALLYLLAILINVEVTCLSVRNVVLIRSSSCIRTSNSSWTLRTLRTLSTSVALFANSLVIRLFAILHPEAIVTDSPNSTRSTINTSSTILNVERLTVAQCYSNTVSSF